MVDESRDGIDLEIDVENGTGQRERPQKVEVLDAIEREAEIGELGKTTRAVETQEGARLDRRYHVAGEIERADLAGERVVEVARHDGRRDEVVREVNVTQRAETREANERIAQRAQVVAAHVQRRRVLEQAQARQRQLREIVGRQVELVVFGRLFIIHIQFYTSQLNQHSIQVYL